MNKPRSVPLIIALPLIVMTTTIVLLSLWEKAGSSVRPTAQPPIPATSLVGIIRTTYPAAIPENASSKQKAPSFNLWGLDGKIHKIEDYLGKKVVLNFWATWCGPCRIEMPLFQGLYKPLEKEDVIIVGVNAGEDEQSVRRYVNELGLTFPILLDPTMITVENYGVLGLPTTFFINAKGIIVGQALGPLTEKGLQAYLKKHS